jgi:hypothetical protein
MKRDIEVKEQSIPNGTKVKIDFKDLEWEMLNETDGAYVKKDNGAECIVESLATFSELGDQDYEYYNLKNIKTGKEYCGHSGYNIVIVKK